MILQRFQSPMDAHVYYQSPLRPDVLEKVHWDGCLLGDHLSHQDSEATQEALRDFKVSFPPLEKQSTYIAHFTNPAPTNSAALLDQVITSINLCLT